jgi:hypothetical protein
LIILNNVLKSQKKVKNKKLNLANEHLLVYFKQMAITYSYPVATKKTAPYPERDRWAIHETLDAFNEKLGVLENYYVIIGGANLVLRGIRRATTDIDLLVSNEVFAEMLTYPETAIKMPPQRAIDMGATNRTAWLDCEWTRAPISAAVSMGDGYFPMSYLGYADVDLELWAGLPLAPLEDVWGSKVALQRPKDITDLRLMASVLGKSDELPLPIYQGPHFDS